MVAIPIIPKSPLACAIVNLRARSKGRYHANRRLDDAEPGSQSYYEREAMVSETKKN